MVHLPWREQHRLLPDNFKNCVARLALQLKRLKRDPEIFVEYDSILQDQLQTGIIEKVDFLHVGIADEDRDVPRFVWVDSLEDKNPGLLFYRFCRVVFGVNASPCLLNATLKHHISQYEADPGLVENLLNSFFVDDLVTGVSGVERCLRFIRKYVYKKCLSEGGFEFICEDQVGTVKTCAFVEDTESYAKTTVNHGEA